MQCIELFVAQRIARLPLQNRISGATLNLSTFKIHFSDPSRVCFFVGTKLTIFSGFINPFFDKFSNRAKIYNLRTVSFFFKKSLVNLSGIMHDIIFNFIEVHCHDVIKDAVTGNAELVDIRKPNFCLKVAGFQFFYKF